MQKTDFTFIAQDGSPISATKWTKDDSVKAKAVVQIAHGMAEHIQRYDRFAQALLAEGFFVYGNDHRGHGKTAGSAENIGYFADQNGWHLVVEDMHQLTTIIKKEQPDVPIILFGHSMGSFLARTYIQNYGQLLAGVILCGTGGNPGLMGQLGILLAKREIRRKGRRARSKTLDRLSFGNYNRAFAPNRSAFDWLSRDVEEVAKYIEDPLCGEVFTAGFFYDMLSGLKEINQQKNIARIPHDLPIFLISGEKDPVGNNTKGVLQVYHTYQAAGIRQIDYKFYKGARHELLNETNRAEVYRDICQWIKTVLQTQ